MRYSCRTAAAACKNNEKGAGEKKTIPCSVGKFINLTFSLIKFYCKNARRRTSHLAMPHYVRGTGDSEVWGAYPKRSHKGNGLKKGSWNQTIVFTTELTQKKDFVVFGESVQSF